jgi:tetratricopeptide (TPR) repeat protein
MPKLVVLSKDLEIPKLNPAPLLIKPKQPDVKSSQPIVKPRRPVVEPNQPVETAKEDLWERAKTAADLEQWDEAHSWLKKAEEQGRFDPEVYYLRGLVEMNAGDIERGIQSLRQAIYCNPDFALAYYTLGDQYHKLGARREALTYWRRAQNVLARLDSQYVLPFSDDMTVEMLKELLSYRLADS